MLHWSANFDEVQDFEGQIRALAGGSGLMADTAFNTGTRSQPLGDCKAGASADLDALAAYVASLDAFAPSPHRPAASTLSATAAEGRALFASRNCAACHGGTAFSSSSGAGSLSDIGTLRASSGKRLGGPLAGIDPPTLRDAWATAPYLHDGSAPTLEAAIRAHANVTATDAEIGSDEAGAPQPAGSATSIWPASVNLGVKFRSDVAGYIAGIRFYKGGANTGTHVGALWSSTGVLLGSATFVNETASGWQEVRFANPVPIAANTVYVASYLAPRGGYAFTGSQFASAGVDNPPLHALRDGESGGNGVYAYASGWQFPSSTWQAGKHWVDVVFSTTAPPDTTAPVLASATPAGGATGVSRTANVVLTFSEALDAASVSGATIELRDAAGTPVPAAVSWDASTLRATLDPGPTLAALASYTVTVRGGATEPRIKDLQGNALAAQQRWSFTTRR